MLLNYEPTNIELLNVVSTNENNANVSMHLHHLAIVVFRIPHVKKIKLLFAKTLNLQNHRILLNGHLGIKSRHKNRKHYEKCVLEVK